MKLSIVIPTYNEEKHLPILLESIKKQNFKDYEIVVGDDSTDNTPNVARKYGCRVVDGRGTVESARNSGAEAAKGEYLLFLDSDVVLTQNYLSSAIAEFEKKGLGIAITQIVPIEGEKIDNFLFGFANSFEKLFETIKPHGAGCCGILTKKSLHEKVGGFDESMDFGEDTDYIERIGRISRFRVLRKPRLLVSARRLGKEGRMKFIKKYIKSTFYQFLGKKISAKQLGGYDFGYESEKENKKRIRIIYAVNGEGLGHATRSKPIIEHLIKEHDVKILAGDRAYDYLSKFFKVDKIHAPDIIYKRDCMNIPATVLKGILSFPFVSIPTFFRVIRIFLKFRPDIIISDFEPYSNWAGNFLRVPSICYDNQHIVTNTQVEFKRKYWFSALLDRIVIVMFMAFSEYYFITTFFYPKIRSKRTFLFAPIVRNDVLRLKPKKKNHVLVYQTSHSYDYLIPALKQLKNEKFVIYKSAHHGVDQNIVYREFSEENFLEDLRTCKAIITNGGFSLISEALYLKKPILSVPVRGQFEQILNAIYLEKAGFGRFYEKLSEDVIGNFIKNLSKYEKNLKKFNKVGNEDVIKKMEEIIALRNKKEK